MKLLLTILLLATPVMAQTTRITSGDAATSGLVGWWPMEDGAWDKSGTMNTGTTANVTFGGGKVGTAAAFNGTSSSIITAANSLDFASGDFSVMAWIRTTTAHTGVIVGKGDTALQGAMWFFYVRSTAPYITLFTQASGGFSSVAQANDNPHDGQWHHLAGVRSGTSNRIYMDGTLRTNLTLTVRDVSNSAQPYIGRRIVTGSPLWFDGQIDELRLYNRVLSAAEISAIYHSRKHIYGGQ